MATTMHQKPHVGRWELTHHARSRGAVSGLALLLLGIWGGIIPFVGPLFGYAYSPDNAWQYTMGRLWLEILPAAACVLAGLTLMGAATRISSQFAGWLGAAAGIWFAVGPWLSTLWTHALPAAGVPVSTQTWLAALERIGFFYGLGAVIVFFAALALGRTSVVSVRDLRDPATDPGHAPGETTAAERPMTRRERRRAGNHEYVENEGR